MTAQDIIVAALECLRVPFRHQGRQIDPGADQGIDCVGVAVHVASRCGLPYVDQQGYGRTPAGTALLDALDAQPCLRVVKRTDMQPGDLLAMRFERDAQHVAIYTGATIIHAYSSAGLCCEHAFTTAWQRRVMRVYRFVEPQ